MTDDLKVHPKQCSLAFDGGYVVQRASLMRISIMLSQMRSPTELLLWATVVPDKRHISDMPGGHRKHLRAGLLW